MVSVIQCDRFDFNYHTFHRGRDCTTLSWNYVPGTCSPATFTLQAFRLSDIRSGQLASPRWDLNSTSPTFSLPTDTLLLAGVNEVLYHRVLGLNRPMPLSPTLAVSVVSPSSPPPIELPVAEASPHSQPILLQPPAVWFRL